jgi:hypothetical protein
MPKIRQIIDSKIKSLSKYSFSLKSCISKENVVFLCREICSQSIDKGIQKQRFLFMTLS